MCTRYFDRSELKFTRYFDRLVLMHPVFKSVSPEYARYYFDRYFDQSVPIYTRSVSSTPGISIVRSRVHPVFRTVGPEYTRYFDRSVPIVPYLRAPTPTSATDRPSFMSITHHRQPNLISFCSSSSISSSWRPRWCWCSVIDLAAVNIIYQNPLNFIGNTATLWSRSSFSLFCINQSSDQTLCEENINRSVSRSPKISTPHPLPSWSRTIYKVFTPAAADNATLKSSIA